MSRKQTPAQKRAADIALIQNAILSFENFLAKYPNDPYNEGRIRQLNQQRAKLADMTAQAA